METFTKIQKSSELVGEEMYKCNMCGCLVSLLETSNHQCTSEIDKELDKELLMIENDVISYLEYKKNNWLFDQLPKLNLAFTKTILRKIILSIFNKRIQNANIVLSSLFDEYTELCKKGISFDERLKIVDFNKVSKIKEEIKELNKQRNNFLVNNLENWLEVGDYEKIKSIGITKFIDLFFEKSFIIKK